MSETSIFFLTWFKFFMVIPLEARKNHVPCLQRTLTVQIRCDVNFRITSLTCKEPWQYISYVMLISKPRPLSAKNLESLTIYIRCNAHYCARFDGMRPGGWLGWGSFLWQVRVVGSVRRWAEKRGGGESDAGGLVAFPFKYSQEWDAFICIHLHKFTGIHGFI